MANDTYAIRSGTSLYAGRSSSVTPPPATSTLWFPDTPTSSGGGGSNAYRFYKGYFDLDPDGFYDDTGGIDLASFGFAGVTGFVASYSRKATLPAAPRLAVFMHPSGGWTSVDNSFAPSSGFDIECKTQDGQAKGTGAEWWCYGRDGLPYPQRRISEMIRKLVELYPTIDINDKGIMCYGNSMGNGGINAVMLLPTYRSKIAYVRGAIGVFMHREIFAADPGQYNWPEDNGANDPIWDAVDFVALASTDSVIRGCHYRHEFGTSDGFSDGVGGVSTQLLWLKTCHDNKISVCASYHGGGHATSEAGYTMPNATTFNDSNQNVTLDRAHPALTNSTGNWPLNPNDITNRATYPRGHFNAGITWNHAGIVDSSTEIIFPLKYTRNTGMGGGVPDQPASITVDVTPRRPRNFTLTNGETINWTWDGGAASGTATVVGDVVTAPSIPLTSGGAYKNLRFYK